MVGIGHNNWHNNRCINNVGPGRGISGQHNQQHESNQTGVGGTSTSIIQQPIGASTSYCFNIVNYSSSLILLLPILHPTVGKGPAIP